MRDLLGGNNTGQRTARGPPDSYLSIKDQRLGSSAVRRTLAIGGRLPADARRNRSRNAFRLSPHPAKLRGSGPGVTDAKEGVGGASVVWITGEGAARGTGWVALFPN